MVYNEGTKARPPSYTEVKLSRQGLRIENILLKQELFLISRLNSQGLGTFTQYLFSFKLFAS